MLALGFLAAQSGLVITAATWFGKSPVLPVLICIVGPFLIWNGLISVAIFLHHTHPAIKQAPRRGGASRAATAGALHGTAHVEFVAPFRHMLLGIMEHNAHQFASGVPLYRLSRMQTTWRERAALVSWRFSWRAYCRVCRQCKLYDYDARKWVTFDKAA